MVQIEYMQIYFKRTKERKKFLLLSYSCCGVEKGSGKIRRNNLSLISFASLLWGSIMDGLMFLTSLNLHALPHRKGFSLLYCQLRPKLFI